MIDTFKPLHLTVDALPYLDENYPMSWNEHGDGNVRKGDMFD